MLRRSHKEAAPAGPSRTGRVFLPYTGCVVAAAAFLTLKPCAAADQTNAPSLPADARSATNAAPARPKSPVANAAKGCAVTVSSTHAGVAGERGAKALVDGDLATRWSSEYSEPQQIVLKFSKPLRVRKVRVHWESACATRYTLAVSANARDWTNAFLFMNARAKAAPRTDEIGLSGELTLALKLDLQTRANPEWGFSLYEIEVVAGP